MDVTERVGQPFEESADEASPSTVTALLVGGLPRGIVLPPALFEAADPTITGSRRKHSHEETSVHRKSAGRHDTIVRRAAPIGPRVVPAPYFAGCCTWLIGVPRDCARPSLQT